MLGIIFKFDIHNISTFEDNYRFMDDWPFAVYFDFKAIYGEKKDFEEGAELYPVLYTIIVPFYPELKLGNIFVQRSFAHSFEELISVAYLSAEMLQYFDLVTAKQLRDCDKIFSTKHRSFQ